jgi:hypothetical protein
MTIPVAVAFGNMTVLQPLNMLDILAVSLHSVICIV